ncbi:terpene synthase family protein [Streptomyces sp. NPDC054863]
MTVASDHRLVQQLPHVPFYCPVPAAAHPAAGVLNELTVDWMFRQHLDAEEEQRRRLALCDFGGLTAATMPYGRLAPLALMAKFHAVLFSLDDGVCDEARPTAGQLARETARIMRAVEAPGIRATGESRHAAALRELRIELETYATPRQLRRWVDAMRVYTSGLVWEAECRRSPGQPSLDDYVTLWMRAIGMAPSTAMMEIVAGYSVPDEDMEDPRVRALTEITWTLVSWDNDLYSRNKELLRADDDLNLVDVLCHELGCGPAQALEQAVEMRDRVMVLFLRLRDQVLCEGGAEVRRYVHDLGQFVRGHLDWAARCPRYTVPLPAGVVAKPVSWWKHRPADDSGEPLPLPTISWWWDQLDSGGATLRSAA